MSNFFAITRRKGSTEYVVAEWLDDHFGNHHYGVRYPNSLIHDEDKVDLIAFCGPDGSVGEKKIDELKKVRDENVKLRGLIAWSTMDCLYCDLKADEQNKCVSGFPGCGRGDDQVAWESPEQTKKRNDELTKLNKSV